MAESAALRDLIHTFIDSRLQPKLDKLKPDEHDKRQQLIQDHQPHNWLAKEIQRLGNIQIATHILKAIHPDAVGSNLYVPPPALTPLPPGLISSHCLGEQWDDDLVNNAAKLYVLDFLNLEHEGRTLLERLEENDTAALAALHDDAEKASEWRDALVALKSQNRPASHSLAKQIYFPLPDGTYHLLAPLFPTSLAHRVQARIREDRFGEAARAAREARLRGEPAERGYCEYPDLAIQKLGGTKPQNIGYLNNKRHGENWLLASLPPQWQGQELRLPLRSDSVFPFLLRQSRDLRNRVKELKHFLVTTDHNNWAIRRKRARLLSEIADEFHQYAARLLEANRNGEPAAGWSAGTECHLDDSERHWLDPLRAHLDPDFQSQHLWRDWPEQVSRRFGNWLNHVLDDDRLRLSEIEAEHWHGVLHDELKMFKEMLEDERA